jgi:hypothetical protein
MIYSPREVKSTAFREEVEDGEFISDMLIPVEFVEEVPADQEGRPNSLRIKRTTERWIYTCKHFDLESRDCTRYEQRPGMCCRFQDEGGCDYEDCARLDE